MVDEAGLTLRQLMRQARKRIDAGGSVIRVSVETFFEFITHSTNVFRLLLRESSGTLKRSVLQQPVKSNTLSMN